MGNIRVIIVDDSALVRQILSKILNAAPDIEVVATASDPYIARQKIKTLNPDVLTLDVEMPKMDGITFLGNLMRLRPMPVVMVSSLTEKGAEITFQALELGAVDYIEKPKLDIEKGLEGYAEDIIEKVRIAAAANVVPLERVRSGKSASAGQGGTPGALPGKSGKRHFRTTDKVIAIGASTGGTEAIKAVLSGLPADAPGVVISQHIPANFSRPFAERMNRSCAMTVRQAEGGEQILPGHVYIAPGDSHLLVVRDGARYICTLSDAPPVNRHRPSVDVMFRSVAENVGPNAIGVILTGMGADGARGMKELHDAGAPTIAQDEASSVVWGMPGEAVKFGSVDYVMPLEEVSENILSLAESPATVQEAGA